MSCDDVSLFIKDSNKTSMRSSGRLENGGKLVLKEENQLKYRQHHGTVDICLMENILLIWGGNLPTED